MKLSDLRVLDHYIGRTLFFFLVPISVVFNKFKPQKFLSFKKQIVVLKLKGGGSLLIAMPALVGIKNANKDKKLILICTKATYHFGTLTGIFDEIHVIDDSNVISLIGSGFQKLTKALLSFYVIDLEHRSKLTAVFCALTFSRERVGFVKDNEYMKSKLYTTAVYFNRHHAIYDYYDQICTYLGGNTATVDDCKKLVNCQIDQRVDQNIQSLIDQHKVIYISAFSSAFARERGLPFYVWKDLLSQYQSLDPDPKIIVLLGGGTEEYQAAEELKNYLSQSCHLQIINVCGQHSLQMTTKLIGMCNEFFGIDSGLLHIARLLGVKSQSFWGPTAPETRLRPIPTYSERIHYLRLHCSPCVDLAGELPCKGNNLCLKEIFKSPKVTQPLWKM